MNITEYENKRDSVCFQCCCFIYGRRASFSWLFQIFVQSRSTQPFIRIFLDKFFCSTAFKQDAQLSQRDRTAGCVIVFAKSRRLELEDNILGTL